MLTQANGKTPYPHKFHLTTNFPDFIDKYTNTVQLKDGESDQSASVSLAGRVWSIRNSGKLCFMDLHSDGMKLQVMAQADVLTSGPMPFDDLIATVRRGDIIGVTGAFDAGIPAAQVLLCDTNMPVSVSGGAGTPARSKRGELSIHPTSAQLLSPCLHMLPTEVTGLKNGETRFRQRCVTPSPHAAAVASRTRGSSSGHTWLCCLPELSSEVILGYCLRRTLESLL
eukprot:COSAG02_NODE_65_length_42645_cov_26.951934_37_plen_226_part_00